MSLAMVARLSGRSYVWAYRADGDISKWSVGFPSAGGGIC
jgi:hypothetical protein